MPLKLVIVDDEPDILELLMMLVRPLDCEVRGFSSSLEAAAYIDEHKVHGVCVDLLMPDLDGIELTKRIRASLFNGSVPIVMLTCHDDAATMQRGFDSGVTFFLGKPFTNEVAGKLFQMMRDRMLQEKIRHARLPLRTGVAFHRGEQAVRAFSLNISVGGMLIEVPGGADIGQQMEIEFAVPDARDLLRLRARVVNAERQNRVGVSFINPPLEIQQTLQSYISDRLVE
ncbi:MAG: response regulator [Myxococcales bacterium]|nr:response regulator [Myxococcales bacterium]